MRSKDLSRRQFLGVAAGSVATMASLPAQAASVEAGRYIHSRNGR